MAITVLFFRKLHCERLSSIIQRWFTDFTGKCCSIITFICILGRLLFVLLFFALAIVLSVLHWFPASDYPFGIFKLLNFTLSVLHWFPASDYPFGIFKLLNFALSVLHWFPDSDYSFGIFKLLTFVFSLLLRFPASDYPFGIFKLLTFHCLYFFDLRPLNTTPLVSSISSWTTAD
jgi:hypothetical protein